VLYCVGLMKDLHVDPSHCVMAASIWRLRMVLFFESIAGFSLRFLQKRRYPSSFKYVCFEAGLAVYCERKETLKFTNITISYD